VCKTGVGAVFGSRQFFRNLFVAALLATLASIAVNWLKIFWH
jgi:hypothetical protein